jgi:hypothetical protein
MPMQVYKTVTTARKPTGHACPQQPHHTLVQMGLDDLSMHTLHLQDMELSFHTIQHALTVNHALLKICRLLEKLEFCGHLSKFPLFAKMKVISKSHQNGNLSHKMILV